MDREVHGGDSSSPNGNFRIITIKHAGTSADIVQVTIGGGPSLFVPSSFCLSRSLGIDTVVQEDVYLSLVRHDLEYRAYRRALDLLSRSDHSIFLLKMKLNKKGFPADVSQIIADRLAEEGYLDDRRFAENYTAARLRRKKESRMQLSSRLISKGVDRVIVEEVIRDIPDSDEADALQEAGRKLLGKAGMTKEKVAASLYRKGFRGEEIRKFIEKNNL